MKELDDLIAAALKSPAAKQILRTAMRPALVKGWDDMMKRNLTPLEYNLYRERFDTPYGSPALLDEYQKELEDMFGMTQFQYKRKKVSSNEISEESV